MAKKSTKIKATTIPTNPETRLELYLDNIAGGTASKPAQPFTRLERYLDVIATNQSSLINKLAGNVFHKGNGTSPAHSQTIPANTVGKAELKMIGGKTVVESETLVSAKTDAVKSVDGENNVVDSFPIPSAVKSLAGYGQSAGSVYNYVDVETKTYRNMIGLKLKDLTWVEYQDGIYHTDPLAHAQINSFPLCPNYFSYNNLSSVLDNDKSACIAGSNDLWIHDSSYTDATAFKNHFGDYEYVHFEASDSTGTDYEARLYHKRVGEVDLGDFDYSYNGMFNQFQSTVLVGAKSNTGYEKANIICVKYETESAVNAYIVGQTRKLISLGGNGKIEIYDSTYYDATAFKTAMSGVYLFYELATEQILDVTSYFSGDVFIEVENGGTLTFVQDDDTQLEIPNTVVYTTDVFA